MRASRAAVDQRRGRAGRTEPGVCYRLWDEPQTASLAAYTQPEILSADLSSLVLDLAQWGVSDPATLAFLDPPPAPALKEARSLLRELGALDGDGRITAEGNSLRALALPPRLARMIVDSHRLGRGRGGGRQSLPCSPSAGLAATASISTSGSTSSAATARNAPAARAAWPSAGPRRWLPPGPLPPPCGVRGERARSRGRDGGSSRRQRLMVRPPPASCWRSPFPTASRATAAMAALCLPTDAAPPSTRLRALARAPYVAVAELTGTAAKGRILLAAPIAQSDIERRFADQIETADEISFDRGAMALRARRKRTLHAITLSEAPLALSPSAETARVLADGLIAAGLDRLPWSKPAKQWRDRVMFLRKAEGEILGRTCPTMRSRHNARHGWCRRCTTRPR